MSEENLTTLESPRPPKPSRGLAVVQIILGIVFALVFLLLYPPVGVKSLGLAGGAAEIAGGIIFTIAGVLEAAGIYFAWKAKQARPKDKDATRRFWEEFITNGVIIIAIGLSFLPKAFEDIHVWVVPIMFASMVGLKAMLKLRDFLIEISSDSNNKSVGQKFWLFTALGLVVSAVVSVLVLHVSDDLSWLGIAGGAMFVLFGMHALYQSRGVSPGLDEPFLGGLVGQTANNYSEVPDFRNSFGHTRDLSASPVCDGHNNSSFSAGDKSVTSGVPSGQSFI